MSSQIAQFLKGEKYLKQCILRSSWALAYTPIVAGRVKVESVVRQESCDPTPVRVNFSPTNVRKTLAFECLGFKVGQKPYVQNIAQVSNDDNELRPVDASEVVLLSGTYNEGPNAGDWPACVYSNVLYICFWFVSSKKMNSLIHAYNGNMDFNDDMRDDALQREMDSSQLLEADQDSGDSVLDRQLDPSSNPSSTPDGKSWSDILRLMAPAEGSLLQDITAMLSDVGSDFLAKNYKHVLSQMDAMLHSDFVTPVDKTLWNGIVSIVSSFSDNPMVLGGLINLVSDYLAEAKYSQPDETGQFVFGPELVRDIRKQISHLFTQDKLNELPQGDLFPLSQLPIAHSLSAVSGSGKKARHKLALYSHHPKHRNRFQLIRSSHPSFNRFDVLSDMSDMDGVGVVQPLSDNPGSNESITPDQAVVSMRQNRQLPIEQRRGGHATARPTVAPPEPRRRPKMASSGLKEAAKNNPPSSEAPPPSDYLGKKPSQFGSVLTRVLRGDYVAKVCEQLRRGLDIDWNWVRMCMLLKYPLAQPDSLLHWIRLALCLVEHDGHTFGEGWSVLSFIIHSIMDLLDGNSHMAEVFEPAGDGTLHRNLGTFDMSALRDRPLQLLPDLLVELFTPFMSEDTPGWSAYLQRSRNRAMHALNGNIIVVVQWALTSRQRNKNQHALNGNPTFDPSFVSTVTQESRSVVGLRDPPPAPEGQIDMHSISSLFVESSTNGGNSGVNTPLVRFLYEPRGTTYPEPVPGSIVYSSGMVSRLPPVTNSPWFSVQKATIFDRPQLPGPGRANEVTGSFEAFHGEGLAWGIDCTHYNLVAPGSEISYPKMLPCLHIEVVQDRQNTTSRSALSELIQSKLEQNLQIPRSDTTTPNGYNWTLLNPLFSQTDHLASYERFSYVLACLYTESLLHRSNTHPLGQMFTDDPCSFPDHNMANGLFQPNTQGHYEPGGIGHPLTANGVACYPFTTTNAPLPAVPVAGIDTGHISFWCSSTPPFMQDRTLIVIPNAFLNQNVGDTGVMVSLLVACLTDWPLPWLKSAVPRSSYGSGRAGSEDWFATTDQGAMNLRPSRSICCGTNRLVMAGTRYVSLVIPSQVPNDVDIPVGNQRPAWVPVWGNDLAASSPGLAGAPQPVLSAAGAVVDYPLAAWLASWRRHWTHDVIEKFVHFMDVAQPGFSLNCFHPAHQMVMMDCQQTMAPLPMKISTYNGSRGVNPTRRLFNFARVDTSANSQNQQCAHPDIMMTLDGKTQGLCSPGPHSAYPCPNWHPAGTLSWYFHAGFHDQQTFPGGRVVWWTTPSAHNDGQPMDFAVRNDWSVVHRKVAYTHPTTVSLIIAGFLSPLVFPREGNVRLSEMNHPMTFPCALVAYGSMIEHTYATLHNVVTTNSCVYGVRDPEYPLSYPEIFSELYPFDGLAASGDRKVVRNYVANVLYELWGLPTAFIRTVTTAQEFNIFETLTFRFVQFASQRGGLVGLPKPLRRTPMVGVNAIGEVDLMIPPQTPFMVNRFFTSRMCRLKLASNILPPLPMFGLTMPLLSSEGEFDSVDRMTFETNSSNLASAVLGGYDRVPYFPFTPSALVNQNVQSVPVSQPLLCQLTANVQTVPFRRCDDTLNLRNYFNYHLWNAMNIVPALPFCFVPYVIDPDSDMPALPNMAQCRDFTHYVSVESYYLGAPVINRLNPEQIYWSGITRVDDVTRLKWVTTEQLPVFDMRGRYLHFYSSSDMMLFAQLGFSPFQTSRNLILPPNRSFTSAPDARLNRIAPLSKHHPGWGFSSQAVNLVVDAAGSSTPAAPTQQM